jgi:hypothetical protein
MNSLVDPGSTNDEETKWKMIFVFLALFRIRIYMFHSYFLSRRNIVLGMIVYAYVLLLKFCNRRRTSPMFGKSNFG